MLFEKFHNLALLNWCPACAPAAIVQCMACVRRHCTFATYFHLTVPLERYLHHLKTTIVWMHYKYFIG